VSDAARRIAVVGAGTMGSGIAQLAARCGADTLVWDPDGDALERGVQRARDGLAREATRGRLDPEEAEQAKQRLAAAASLEAFADRDLVIEAAPERLALKHALLEQLCAAVGEECVLATNTSSLPVTAVAAGASHPERVVGMHFFNPAPVMRLVEVIAGVRTGQPALALVSATGEAMGRTVIRASDGPGFLVNRCNRPYGLEGLRLLGERLADVETIDRICRGAGFPMGPFELMDLVGIDTGLQVSESFYEQSYGEPRWRPSPIAARYAAAGLLGRKSARGYYTYTKGDDGRLRWREEDPPLPQAGPPDLEGLVVIDGEIPLADELRAAARNAGLEVRDSRQNGRELPALWIDCSLDPEPYEPRGATRLLLCARRSLADQQGPDGASVGFHALGPWDAGTVVELTRGPGSSPLAVQRAERFFAALGRHTVWVADAPGLVLGRIVCQLINEAAFAFGEGVGSASDIDLGMTLGLAHPRGPMAWGDAIGLGHVRAVLAGLWETYHEERYRTAPALAAAARDGVRLQDLG
jgi:3-hydroxybutyryl-CoA dehydrogenase